MIPSETFVRLYRSQAAIEIVRDPAAWALMTLIALRARYKTGGIDGLSPGQAKIGDWEACGLTRKQARTAMGKLAKAGYCSFRGTKGIGTIATILDLSIFGISGHVKGQCFPSGKREKGPFEGPTKGHAGANNNKEEEGNKEGGSRRPRPRESDGAWLKRLQVEWPDLNVRSELAKAFRKKGKNGEKVEREWFEVKWLPNATEEVSSTALHTPAIPPSGNWRSILNRLYPDNQTNPRKDPWESVPQSIRNEILALASNSLVHDSPDEATRLASP